MDHLNANRFWEVVVSMKGVTPEGTDRGEPLSLRVEDGSFECLQALGGSSLGERCNTGRRGQRFAPVRAFRYYTFHRDYYLPTPVGIQMIHLQRVGTAVRPCPCLPVLHLSSRLLPPKTCWHSNDPSSTRRDSGSPLSAPSGVTPFIKITTFQCLLLLSSAPTN